MKAMAIQGRGLAFLPASLVTKDLCARRPVPVAKVGSFGLAMDARIDRERPSGTRRGQESVRAPGDVHHAAASG